MKKIELLIKDTDNNKINDYYNQLIKNDDTDIDIILKDDTKWKKIITDSKKNTYAYKFIEVPKYILSSSKLLLEQLNKCVELKNSCKNTHIEFNKDDPNEQSDKIYKIIKFYNEDVNIISYTTLSMNYIFRAVRILNACFYCLYIFNFLSLFDFPYILFL